MKTDQEAEDALPPGVAKGLRMDTTPREQQLQAGGIGPGGQVGPDPSTRRLQEGGTHALDETARHEGQVADSHDAVSPTPKYNDAGASVTAPAAYPQQGDA
jgi:hypothetical protein